ncbi:MAG: MFS transporter [Anaerolineales bacterium]|nr:MFS transporter [Anaerolineales bacterium]
MNKNIGILFFTLVVVMIGFGIVIPILPFYVESLGGGGFEMGLLMSLFALMQFFFSPLWGSLSDRIGRKPVLMIGIIGNAAAMFFMGISGNLPTLLSSRALAGILSSATIPTAMAFISDSTNEEERGGGMGIIGAAMGIGMVLGPGVGGILSDISLSMPFFLAAGLSLLAAILIWLLLPESLKTARAASSGVPGLMKLFNSMRSALAGPLGFLMILAFLLSFAMTNFESVFGLYGERRFDYDAKTIGLILTVIGLISAVVQGALTGPATRRFGEAVVIKVSLIGSAIGFILMLQAFNLTTVMITCSVFIFSNAMLRPGIASLISKRAVEGQGSALGLNNAFMSLGRFIGPLLAGFLLDRNLNLPYLTGASIMLTGFIASLLFIRKGTQEAAAQTKTVPTQT